MEVAAKVLSGAALELLMDPMARAGEVVPFPVDDEGRAIQAG